MIDRLRNLFRLLFAQKPEAVNASGNFCPVNQERRILEEAVRAFNLKKLSV